MPTTEPKVLHGSPPRKRGMVRPWSEDATYQVVGWAGVVLGLAAVSDYVLAFYPLGFGSAEWEIATIGAVVQGLPLFSIAAAAIWLSAAHRSKKWVLVTVGWGLGVVAAVLLLGLIVFLTDVPLAVRATQSLARVGIIKLVIRTLFMGLVFAMAYVVMAVMALRQARGRSPRETNA